MWKSQGMRGLSGPNGKEEKRNLGLRLGLQKGGEDLSQRDVSLP